MSFTDTMLLPCKHDVHTRSQRQLDTTNLRPRMRVHVTTPVLHKQMDATTHCELQRRIRGTQQQTAWDVKPTSSKEKTPEPFEHLRGRANYRAPMLSA